MSRARPEHPPRTEARAAASAYNNRGLAWRDKGDLDRAIADYDQAIRLDPKDATTYFDRGLVKRAKGDIPGGDADVAIAKNVDPTVRP